MSSQSPERRSLVTRCVWGFLLQLRRMSAWPRVLLGDESIHTPVLLGVHLYLGRRTSISSCRKSHTSQGRISPTWRAWLRHKNRLKNCVKIRKIRKIITQPSALTLHPSSLTFHHSSLTPHSSALSPHSSLFTPQPSALTLHPSALSPHSSALSPQPSLFTTQPSLFSSHSSPLTPQPSLFAPQPHPSATTHGGISVFSYLLPWTQRFEA